MRAVMTRDLIVAARRAAAALTVCSVAALLIAFVLIWSPGVPVLAPLNLYEQTRLLHWWVLAAALPWTAVRSAPHDRGDDFVLMAAFIGVPPASAVAGKILAMFVLLVLVILTGLPALLIAQQAAAVSLGTVARDLFPLAGLALLVAAASTASILMLRDSLPAWLATTTITAVVLFAAVVWTSGTAAVGALCALAGAIGSASVCTWSNGSLRYLGHGAA
jgi:hypothetical protein